MIPVPGSLTLIAICMAGVLVLALVGAALILLLKQD